MKTTLLAGVSLALALANPVHASVYEDGACPILTLLPFSNGVPNKGAPSDIGGESTWPLDFTANFGFAMMAATQIAIKHFNDRNPAVVPQIAELGNCSVYFPHQVVANTEFDHSAATSALLDNIDSQCSTQTKTTPCAVVGPTHGRAATHLQSITGALKIPQMVFYINTGILLNESTSIGLTPSITQNVEIMLSLLRDREHLLVVYGAHPQDVEAATTMQRLASQYDLKLAVSPAKSHIGSGGREGVAKNAKLSGIKTIVLRMQEATGVIEYAKLFEKEGMLTSEYTYILNEKAVPSDRFARIYGDVEVDSPLGKLLNGALMIDRLDAFRSNEDDPFLTAWRQQDGAFVEQMNTLMPLSQDSPGYFHAADDYFQTVDPPDHVAFAYDSVMALGFGGCIEMENRKAPPAGAGQSIPSDAPFPQQDVTMPPPSGSSVDGTRKLQDSLPRSPPGGDTPRKLDPHVAGILASEFDGASGHLSWKNQSQGRDGGGLQFGLYNMRQSATVDASTGKRPLESVLVSVYQESTGWTDIAGESLRFRDGSSTFPLAKREPLNDFFLPSWVRAFGLTMFGLAVGLALTGIAAVAYLRKDPLIVRAQPFFMHLLCAGSITTSTAIFTLSWDEAAGWTDRQLDIACMMTPWFFFIGHIMMFSAMFTKLWRVDKVLQFRRTKVTVLHVLGPLAVLLAATLIVLVTWTVYDPWSWERTIISEIPFETYGECGNEHFWAFFGPLMGLIVFAEGTSAFFAWKTSDLPEDFRESQSVLFTICTHIQAWIIGVPILSVLHQSSSDATYFGRVLLIWLFSVSGVVCAVYPKIFRAIQLRRRPELRQKDRVSVTGIYAPSTGGPRTIEYSLDQSHLQTGSFRQGSADMVETPDPPESAGTH